MAVDVVFSSPCERLVNVRTADIGQGLSVYLRTTTISEILADGSSHRLSSSVTQGVVDDENLVVLVSGRPDFKDYVPFALEKDRSFHPLFITAGGRELVRNKGNPIAHPNLWGQMVSAGMIHDRGGAPLVDLVASGMTVDDLCFVHVGEHALVDVDGRPVMHALPFDYMHGCLHEEAYDLEAALEVLSANPEVTIISEDPRGSLISKIPYYNVTSDCALQIVANWVPTGDSWNEMLARLGFDKENPGLVRIRSDFALGRVDLFGLAGCRKADFGHDPWL